MEPDSTNIIMVYRDLQIGRRLKLKIYFDPESKRMERLKLKDLSLSSLISRQFSMHGFITFVYNMNNASQVFRQKVVFYQLLPEEQAILRDLDCRQ